MQESRAVALRFVASQLVFISALVHLGVGLIEWLNRIRFGILVPLQFRYPLFVFAGVAVLAGLAVAWQSPRRRIWYLLGFVTMLGFVFAYFGYHLNGHRQFVLFGQQLAPAEAVNLDFFVVHYFASALSTVTLTVELLAAALLAVLYVTTEE